MLVSLSISDIVLIDRLELEWQPNLCTLTGETGASMLNENRIFAVLFVM